MSLSTFKGHSNVIITARRQAMDNSFRPSQLAAERLVMILF